MAMTAWSAKVLQQLDLLVAERPYLGARVWRERRWPRHPASSGTARMVRCPSLQRHRLPYGKFCSFGLQIVHMDRHTIR